MRQMICRDNYRLVQKFLEYQAGSVAPTSLDRYRFHLRHLLLWAMDTHLANAQNIQPSFAAYVSAIESPTGGTLARESKKKIFNMARQFFEWAKMEYPSEFKKISIGWIQKIRLPKHSNETHSTDKVNLELLRNDSVSLATKLKFVTLDQVRALANLPKSEEDLAHWRDCAMAALLYLSGMRARAAVTIPIGAVHFGQMCLRQWTELGVKTKNGKSATTVLYDIPELLEAAQSWDDYIRARLPLDAPWYTPIENQWGDQRLSSKPIGKNRSVGVNKRLRLLFAEAGLPYKSAHAFRHGHAVYGLEQCRTIADYKAVSLNMMHETLSTTDGIYVHIQNKDIQERILALTESPAFDLDTDFIATLAKLSKEDKARAISFLADELAR